MKRLLILATCLTPMMLLGCNKNKSLTKDEFFVEYQKRLDKFYELGEIYKSVETDPNDYFSMGKDKIMVKSNTFGYYDSETKPGEKNAVINYYSDESKTSILGGSISGQDVDAIKEVIKPYEQTGTTFSPYIESKTNYLVMECKTENPKTSFIQKIDENCYVVEVLVTATIDGITNGNHVHNTYKK